MNLRPINPNISCIEERSIPVETQHDLIGILSQTGGHSPVGILEPFELHLLVAERVVEVFEQAPHQMRDRYLMDCSN